MAFQKFLFTGLPCQTPSEMQKSCRVQWRIILLDSLDWKTIIILPCNEIESWTCFHLAWAMHSKDTVQGVRAASASSEDLLEECVAISLYFISQGLKKKTCDSIREEQKINIRRTIQDQCIQQLNNLLVRLYWNFVYKRSSLWNLSYRHHLSWQWHQWALSLPCVKNLISNCYYWSCLCTHSPCYIRLRSSLQLTWVVASGFFSLHRIAGRISQNQVT